MKKAISLLLLFLGIVLLVPGQAPGPIDLVLVLDTSASMSGSQQAVTDYVTGPFLREFLRIGDTFHLISFSGTSRSEISRRIEGVGDVETLIGRLFLMFPVDPYSDIAGALDYTERYVTQLPSSRPKKVVFITDGDQSPRPGSSSAAVDSAALETLISGTAARLRRNGTDFNLVKFPLTGSGPSSGRPSRPAASASSARSGGPAPTQPAAPQQPARETPVQTQPSGETPARTQPATPPPAPIQPEVPAAQQPVRETPAWTQPATPAPTPTPTPVQPEVPATQQPVRETPVRTQPATPQTESVQPEVPAAQQPVRETPVQTQPATPQTEPVQPEVPARTQPATPPPTPVQTQPDGGTSAQSQPTTPQTEPVRPEVPARTQPAGETPVQTREVPAQRQAGSGGFNFLPLIVGLGIALVVLILGLIIFLMTRRLNASPNRAMAYMSGRNVSSSPGKKAGGSEGNTELLQSYAEGQRRGRSPASIAPTVKAETLNDEPLFRGPVLLSLVVDDQSTSIGRRNTHAIKAGQTYTIGGSKTDDFLIFLVPMPAHLGELQFNGRQCTFTPKKARYFPEIGSQTVPNCIGKTISVISDKRYELTFHFERYEDPLDSLNRLLNSINLPPKLPEKAMNASRVSSARPR